MTDGKGIGADPRGGSGPDEPRVAVVTGGSSGIGLATAEQLARLGWVVALVGRTPDRLSSATQRVCAAAPDPARVHPYRADFAVLAQVRALATPSPICTAADTYTSVLPEVAADVAR